MKNNGNRPLVVLSHVSAGYGRGPVVRDASACVMPGDFIVLRGGNGSGKSTLLRLMAGLLRPGEGGLTRRGGLRTGYLPQHRTIDRTFPVTVRQVVLSGMASRHAWWRRCPAPLCADAEALMERLGLADLATRPIEALSGGQWQRTLIARALAGRPDLLLLDEPETHLDADTRALLYELLREEAAERAVVMVSHEDEKTGDGQGRTVWHMEDGVLTAAPAPHL